MKRVVELVAFFGLATVLGTIAIRLYESPDGKMLWDYFVVREPPPAGSEPAFFKNTKMPDWNFESAVEFPNNVTLDGPLWPKGAFDWKNESAAPKQERRRNSPSWTDALKSRRPNSPPARQPSRPPSGPWMSENPFAK